MKKIGTTFHPQYSDAWLKEFKKALKSPNFVVSLPKEQDNKYLCRLTPKQNENLQIARALIESRN